MVVSKQSEPVGNSYSPEGIQVYSCGSDETAALGDDLAYDQPGIGVE